MSHALLNRKRPALWSGTPATSMRHGDISGALPTDAGGAE